MDLKAPSAKRRKVSADTVEQAGTFGWKGNDEARWHAFKHGLHSKHRETLRRWWSSDHAG